MLVQLCAVKKSARVMPYLGPKGVGLGRLRGYNCRLVTLFNLGNPMTNLTRSLPAILILFLAACSTLTQDIQVESQADPKVNFAGYSSFAWLGSSEIVYDPDGQWEPSDIDVDAEVRFEINKQLRKRGMIEVTGDPDMFVVFGAGLDMAALGVRENPDTGENMLVNLPQAALMVGLIDAETGFLVWRGLAEGEAVADRDLEDTRKRIAYAVEKMFKQIP